MLPNNHDKHTPIGEIKERPSPAKRGIAHWEARYLEAVDCLQRVYDEPWSQHGMASIVLRTAHATEP